MPDINLAAIGVSPQFSISGEEFILRYFQSLSPVSPDIVKPPTLGENGGYSAAMEFTNAWFPWADEKLREPKYDGVCMYLGTPSNDPTLLRDYHLISLLRAVDTLLAPKYEAVIMASVDTVVPQPPPIPTT